MSIYAELPDGVRLEFPDGTDEAVIQRVVKAQIAAQQRPAPAQPVSSEPEAPAWERASPTDGMSMFDKLAAGAGKAIVDTGRGIAGLLGADNKQEIRDSRERDKALMSTGAGTVGNIAGHVGMALLPGAGLKGAGTLLQAGSGALGAGAAGARLGMAGTTLNALGTSALAPTTIKGAAALGAATGAAQPAVDVGERVKNVAAGAAGGAGGQALFRGLARVASPKTAPEVRTLLDQGITPTPGQILGGVAKRAEDGLTSVPIVGDAIKRAQTRALDDLNVAAFNRALQPVGQKLPAGLKGREAVEFVGDTLGARYNALLPRLTTQADQQFAQEVGNLSQMVNTGAIDPNAANAFRRILQNDVLGKFQGQNAISGQTLKAIEGDLGQQIKRLGQSTDADQRLVADALSEVQSALRGLVTRNNPQAADELRAINTGYANFKRVQRAASGLGAEDGVFSAAQLQNAVKALDRSKDKARFAEGNALMQDLSDPAKAVLGSTVPDSGTPFRSMTALLAGGGAAGMTLGPGAAAAVAAGPMLYSRAGQNALATLLARRGAAAEPTANALRRLAPYATLPGIGLANE